MKRTKLLFIFLLSFLVLLSSCSKNSAVELSEQIVAVEAGSTEYSAVQELKNNVKEIQAFSTLDGAVAAVEAREVNYVVMNEFSAAQYIENKRKIETVKRLNFTTEYCAYFHDNDELLNNFNSTVFELNEKGIIEKIKEAYKKGEAYYPELTKLSDDAPVITIAFSITGSPFCDLTDEGAVVGIDVDIATIVANRLGYNLEIMILSPDDAFSLLAEDEIDMMISGLMYEPERSGVYDCSLSYLTVHYYLLSRD